MNPEEVEDSEVRVDQLFQEQSRLAQVSDFPMVHFILGTTPYLGGIGTLLSRSLQRRQEVRLRRFLVELAQELEASRDSLADKIDYGFLNSEEFAGTVEVAMSEVSRTIDDEKLDYLQRFIVSSALKERPDATWRDLFAKYLSQLSGIHLVLLHQFYALQGGLPASDRLGGVRIGDSIPMSVEAIRGGLRRVDSRLGTVACVDLDRLGLLADWRSLSSSNQEPQRAYCITDNGIMFMQFLHNY